MKKLVYICSFLLPLTIAVSNDVQAQSTKKEETKSHKGKDAAIGGGVGAVTGAVVSHKHGKGAVVGGVVGAGAGYLYGRHKDKKQAAHKKHD